MAVTKPLDDRTAAGRPEPNTPFDASKKDDKQPASVWMLSANGDRPVPMNLIRILYFALIALLLFQVDFNEAFAQGIGRYPSKDSGVLARTAAESDVNWLDNERAIFIGSMPGETRVENGVQKRKHDLYVWNTVSGDIRREAELSFDSGLCVGPGYVRYHFQREGVYFVRYGEVGRTQESELDVQAMKDGILAVSPVSCRDYNPKLLRKRYGNWALPLLEPGEYLDRTSRDHVAPLRYFPADGSDAVLVPKIPNRDAITIPKYSQYADKYVFSEIRRHGGSEFTQRAWSLDRFGNATEFVLPAGPWMKALSVAAMPTRKGWAMSSRASGTESAFGAAGIYLVQGAKVSRVVTAFPYFFAVSPDGCKIVAAMEAKKREEIASPRVWMIDLCAGGV